MTESLVYAIVAGLIGAVLADVLIGRTAAPRQAPGRGV
jgi:hypothetical protein